MTVRRQLAPWAGLVAGAFGWAAAHQLGSNAVFDDCRAGAPSFLILIGLAGLAIALIGGLVSLASWRRDGETGGRRFVALVGAMLAALAAFAIVLQSAAVLILPPCAA